MKKQDKWWLVVTLVVLLVISLAVPPARAATFSPAAQANLKKVLKKNNVNGVVLVGRRTNQPQVISHRTTTNPQQVVSADRLFPIASFQKLMTGVAVEQLVQTGQLNLSTPLSDYFPQIPLAGQVTVDRMMMHMSGLGNQPRPLKRPLSGEKAQVQYALRRCRSNGDFTWHYTDLDFIMLAAVIRSVSHHSYRQYLTKQVLAPAGVRVKFYNQARPSQVTQAVGKGRTWSKLQLAMSPELGAGDIFCSPNDYWRFYNRVVLGDPALLTKFLAKRDPTGAETYFGGTYLESPYLHANGYLAGYSCSLYSNYQRQQTMMFFANNISYHQLRALNSQLYHACFGGHREEQATINTQ